MATSISLSTIVLNIKYSRGIDKHLKKNKIEVMKKRRKYETKELRIKIDKLIKQGFSFAEVADMLRLNSRQLVRYHYRRFRGLDK